MEDLKERYDELRKRSDKQAYEIAEYIDEVRTLKLVNKIQAEKINILANALMVIRDAHREVKDYATADLIRNILVNAGIEVKDGRKAV